MLSRTPQVLVTLAPDGSLQAELPGANGARRRMTLRSGDCEATLQRILRAQQQGHVAIGEDGAPTQQQVRHWERHEIFADDRCPFCVAEGRTHGGTGRRSRVTVLSDYGGVTIRRVAARVRGPGKPSETTKSAEELGL